MRFSVVVTARKVGFHRWPEAPDEVRYLRDRHRHEFHVRAWKNVSRPDRDIEIIALKGLLGFALYDLSPMGEFGTMSCEQIAAHLVTKLTLDRCEVLEDGENGGIAEP